MFICLLDPQTKMIPMDLKGLWWFITSELLYHHEISICGLLVCTTGRTELHHITVYISLIAIFFSVQEEHWPVWAIAEQRTL